LSIRVKVSSFSVVAIDCFLSLRSLDIYRSPFRNVSNTSTPENHLKFQ
jgi:hypothetical protein